MHRNASGMRPYVIHLQGYIFIYFLSTSFNTASSAAPQIGTVCRLSGDAGFEPVGTVATFSLAVRHSIVCTATGHSSHPIVRLDLIFSSTC